MTKALVLFSDFSNFPVLLVGDNVLPDDRKQLNECFEICKLLFIIFSAYTANIYLLKVNYRNTNFQHTLHSFIVFLLLTLNK